MPSMDACIRVSGFLDMTLACRYGGSYQQMIVYACMYLRHNLCDGGNVGVELRNCHGGFTNSSDLINVRG